MFQPIPLVLLRLLGRAVLRHAGRAASAELPGLLAADVWSGWCAALAAEARRAEIKALLAASEADLRAATTELAAELTAGNAASAAAPLAAYLASLPTAIRQAMRAVPGGGRMRVQDAPDLIPLLPSPQAFAAVDGEDEATRSYSAVPGLPEVSRTGEAAPGVTLAVVEGPHQGQSFSFNGHDTFLVGRSSRAHFQLPQKDKYFSRVHFMIEVNPPRCRLMDMNSHNGTYVNDTRVSRAELRDGDRIKAGHTVLRVTVHASPESHTALGVPASAAPGDSAEWQGLDTAAPAQPQASPDSVATAALPAAAAPAAARTSAVGMCLVCGTASSTDVCPGCREAHARRPQMIPGYLLLGELGRGGMGVVYLAARASDGVAVAIKTIVPAVAGNPKQVERFLREAAILGKLRHPNIVAFQQMGEAQGRLYFAMDYVRGTDASRLLKTGGPLAIGRAVGLACQLLEGLEFAHRQRFVHRDIKPANLLVATEGGREVVRVADFGLARTYQASQLSGLTLAGELGGTVAFMPPEQVLNYRDTRPPADQYAAAATLYCLLTGRCVYDKVDTVEEHLSKILQEDPVKLRARRPEVPTELESVIHRGLAREAADRYADVGAMRRALLPFVG